MDSARYQELEAIAADQARRRASVMDDLHALALEHMAILNAAEALHMAREFDWLAGQPFPCTAETPCCPQKGVFNGVKTGPGSFRCPVSCNCHD